MPNYVVCKHGCTLDERIWVYAIDEWDAREQIASTLNIDAHNTSAFECREDPTFKTPLDVIFHATGERTEVAIPRMLRGANDDDDCGPAG